MKRILVASDLSLCSANALARAIGLAARDGAEIRIVHACADEEGRDDRQALHRKVATEARIMAEELTGRALDFSVRISSAGPGHAITSEAKIFDADLVILGVHGETRFRDAVFGTTGTYVVRHCGCPILIVQNDACEPYAKMLVAIEATATASDILASALEIAPLAEMFAVHAFYPTLRQAVGGEAAFDRQLAHQELEIEKLLGASQAGGTLSRFAARRHAIIETGEALEVIMKETKALSPDLLVMGTRQRSIVFDSHAVDILFTCENDLLIVPEREPVAPAPMATA
jgi:nucleotide-binding universal stress UspA family protein